MHLHLCFDGNETPVSFHLEDVGQHHDEPTVDAAHTDVDIAVVGEALVKILKASLHLPALLFAVLLLGWLLCSQRQRAPGFRNTTFYQGNKVLRPPLRGPPALISP